MKQLKWFKVGDQIPNEAVFTNQSRTVVDKEDRDELGPYIAESHLEYLYEIIIETGTMKYKVKGD